MRTALIIMSFLFFLPSSFACEIGVNDTYQKNMLTAYAANHFNVPLSEVRDVSIFAYDKLLEGAQDCPDRLNTWGRVDLSWRTQKGNTCRGAVTVEVVETFGEEVYSSSQDDVLFLAPQVSCEN